MQNKYILKKWHIIAFVLGVTCIEVYRAVHASETQIKPYTGDTQELEHYYANFC